MALYANVVLKTLETKDVKTVIKSKEPLSTQPLIFTKYGEK